MNEPTFIATAPAGVEPLLAAELTGLGAVETKPVRGGIRFQGSLELAYRACLWLRTASRVLLVLAEIPAADASELYSGIHELPWEEHLDPDGTLAVDFGGACAGIDHSHFGAQRVKDAVVDRFRARCGRRPGVDRLQPDLRIQVQARDGQALIGQRATTMIPIAGSFSKWTTSCSVLATARGKIRTCRWRGRPLPQANRVHALTRWSAISPTIRFISDGRSSIPTNCGPGMSRG